MDSAAIILAAGKGTRMKSEKPKVLHEIMGTPLITWVVRAAKEAEIENIVTVVGHQKELVIPLVEADTQIAVQENLIGTADAVLSTEPLLGSFEGSLVVLNGDCPLITPATIRKLIEHREESGAAVVVLTMVLDDPYGYGRIIRNDEGEVLRIVEQKDANEEEAAVTECNSGFYCFDAQALFAALKQVSSDNAQGEYYLTDVLEICRKAGRSVQALATEDNTECLGVNTVAQLAEAERQMAARAARS